MNCRKRRAGKLRPRGAPMDESTAQVLVLTILAATHPHGSTVPKLEDELGGEGQEWVEQAVRDLAAAELVRCEGERVFAEFDFPDPENPMQPES
jgi:hypothetical protein